MIKRNLISLVAAGTLVAGSAWLGAQTEVPAPTEELLPAPAPADPGVDDKTKAAADDALKNFKAPSAEPVTVEPAAPVAVPAMEAEPVAVETPVEPVAPVTPAVDSDPIIPSPPSASEIEAAKAQAKAMGVSEENIEKAEEAVGDAATKLSETSASEVEDAMKALEALGQQAKKALEEAEVVGEGPETTGTARDVAVEPGDDGSLMPDNLGLDQISPDAAERANQVVRELGADPAALARIDAKRQEFVSKIMAESDRKKAKLTFRRAFTAASNSPDAIALKASAEQAATDAEKRDLMRQYYSVVFSSVNKRAPGIQKYTEARQAEYMQRIDSQLPPTEAISLAPIEGEPGVVTTEKPGTDT